MNLMSESQSSYEMSAAKCTFQCNSFLRLSQSRCLEGAETERIGEQDSPGNSIWTCHTAGVSLLLHSLILNLILILIMSKNWILQIRQIRVPKFVNMETAFRYLQWDGEFSIRYIARCLISWISSLQIREVLNDTIAELIGLECEIELPSTSEYCMVLENTHQIEELSRMGTPDEYAWDLGFKLPSTSMMYPVYEDLDIKTTNSQSDGMNCDSKSKAILQRVNKRYFSESSDHCESEIEEDEDEVAMATNSNLDSGEENPIQQIDKMNDQSRFSRHEEVDNKHISEESDVSTLVSKNGENEVASDQGQSTDNNFVRENTFHYVYKVSTNKLGAGAKGKVFLCSDRKSGEECAVKVIKRPFNQRKLQIHYPFLTQTLRNSQNERVHNRVMKEVQTLDICRNHPYIVNILDCFEEEDEYLLVMEMMRGGNLIKAVQSLPRDLTEKEAAVATAQVALAISFLHQQGIAHRDLKPENVLCSDAESLFPLKLADFDLASKAPTTTIMFQDLSLSDSRAELDPDESNIANELWFPPMLTAVGTLVYMSPEMIKVFKGEQYKYGKKIDSWGLGQITYFLLTKETAFAGGNCGSPLCKWTEGIKCPRCSELIENTIREGNYKATSAAWSALSNEAKDLIGKLLECDPCKRIGIQEVLEHPWIKRHARLIIEKPPVEAAVPRGSLNHIAMKNLTIDLDEEDEELTLNLRTACIDPFGIHEPDTSIISRTVSPANPNVLDESICSETIQCCEDPMKSTNVNDVMIPDTPMLETYSPWAYTIPGNWKSLSRANDFNPFA